MDCVLGQALTLATIPAQEWDALADLCVDGDTPQIFINVVSIGRVL